MLDRCYRRHQSLHDPSPGSQDMQHPCMYQGYPESSLPSRTRPLGLLWGGPEGRTQGPAPRDPFQVRLHLLIWIILLCMLTSKVVRILSMQYITGFRLWTVDGYYFYDSVLFEGMEGVPIVYVHQRDPSLCKPDESDDSDPCTPLYDSPYKVRTSKDICFPSSRCCTYLVWGHG